MFQGEVVIVTGAGGNLGGAVVALLKERGAKPVPVDKVDLTDPGTAGSAVADALEQHGRVDGLVNTVGTFAMGGIDEAKPELWDFLYRVNLHTALNMSRAVVGPMRDAGRGRIVNIGAIPALRAPSGFSAYAASKSAVLRLTESLADELKGHGITVNAVLPGIIDTPQNRAAMPDADTSNWVTPTQIAEVIAFLCSPAGNGVNGALIPVSGRG